MQRLSRRDFSKVVAAGLTGLSVSPLWAALARRNLKVGHTGITWGFGVDDLPAAINDIGSLGYQGFEPFGNVIEAWEERGGIGQLLEAANLPLQGAYCNMNLTDAARRAEQVETIVRWGRLIRKYGGSVAVIGPNGVRRQNFDFAASKGDIVATLNDIGMALMDVGVVPALHPHTGTCVETEEETYAIMEAVDTRHVKFGPDFGQLQKAEGDPVKVMRDFASITHHVHMKDFNGGEDFLGYCPLGQGQLQVEALADLCESAGNDIMIMVELDASRNMPMTPLETARISKEHLRSLNYAFPA